MIDTPEKERTASNSPTSSPLTTLSKSEQYAELVHSRRSVRKYDADSAF